MIKRAPFVIAALAALTGTAMAMPPAQEWEIGPWARGKNYSVNMPATPRAGPDGSLIVDFPRHGRGEWDAMTTRIAPLKGAKTITVRYRIDAAPGTRFVAVDTPNKPATISLYFQRAGDTWTAKGKYASYRWYAPRQTVMPLSVGEHIISVRLDDRWTNVYNKTSFERPREFAGALQNTHRLGIAMGSHTRRSHGVAATGPARFTLLSVDFD